jgi:septal ring factor EnvC (AmiA/AmiB activator)
MVTYSITVKTIIMKSNHASAMLSLLAMLCLSFILFFPFSLYAQNLDDFRSAAAADGVKLIPFPDLRSDASSLADDVQKRKDDVKSLDYDVFAKQKDNILTEIKKKKEEIDGIRKEIDDFKKKFAEVSTSCMEDGIKTKEQAIADNNKKLDELNAKLKDAATAFDNLNIARAKLREQFDKVLSELSNAKSSSGKYIGESPSDEDKSKFENYLSVIADQIKSQIEEHKKQEDGAKNTKDKFDQLIRKTEL